MPNQRDVATYAGVSSASVSRYLTNPEMVKPATAEKIRLAIDKLDYKLDYYARSLKTGRSYHIGILLPGIGPFYWEILQGIQDKLTRNNFFNTIFYTRDIDGNTTNSREQLSAFLNNNMIEGVIFFPLSSDYDEELLINLGNLHENLVIVDRDVDQSRYDQITVDNFESGRRAARELYNRGHREMLYLQGQDNSYSTIRRLEGFKKELAERGIELKEDRILHGDYTSRTAYRLGKQRLPDLPRFTGFFATNDASAIGFIKAAREFGLRCPEDFSAIGFDNNEEFAPYMTPSLSTFQQPLVELGTLAAQRLIDQIEDNSSPQKTILQTEFILRESLKKPPKCFGGKEKI
jgi:DNA-binding LacI/PurR family transcriptional regulator